MRREFAAVLLLTGCARGSEPPPDATASAPPAAEAATSPRSCLRLELAPLTIVRVDEPQRRLFVVTTDAGETPVAARIHDLESCFDFTDGAGRWSLSVFTDAALARYKDDAEVESAVKDGRWSKAYVAEYSASTKKTTRNPAGP
jgi:hypothetical protein